MRPKVSKLEEQRTEMRRRDVKDPVEMLLLADDSGEIEARPWHSSSVFSSVNTKETGKLMEGRPWLSLKGIKSGMQEVLGQKARQSSSHYFNEAINYIPHAAL